jgi:hypothetical protein
MERDDVAGERPQAQDLSALEELEGELAALQADLDAADHDPDAGDGSGDQA